MIAKTPNQIIEMLAYLGDQLPEVQAIGISGSRVHGEVDAFSDADFCVFVRDDYPALELRLRAYSALGLEKPIYFDVNFDTSRGDGFRVDRVRCDFNWMVIEKVQDFLANLEVNFDCAEWLPGGLASVKATHDPQNVIQQLQSEIPKYPVTRSRHRVRQALREAHFSLYELQWLPKAAFRGDTFSFLKYQYLLIEKFFYTIFALNRVWFSDEKRLAARIMDFKLVPPQADKRIQAIILHKSENKNLENSLKEIKRLFLDTCLVVHQYNPDLEIPLEWE